MRDLTHNVGNVLTIQHQTCVDEIFKCTIFVGYGGVIFFLPVFHLIDAPCCLKKYDYGICMRRRDHNKCVLPHLFSGPWMVDARGGGGRNISGWRTHTDAHLRMRH